MEKFVKKSISILISLSMIFSCFLFEMSVSAEASSLQYIVDKYVEANKNSVTPDGLLTAVQADYPGATLDYANDFYIKHAVNGVRDNTTDYPLNIEGSDGSVAAIFEINGERCSVISTFAHETEQINITETAVVGTSAGFTYDANGNVTAYSGTADKMVFPKGYNGTMLASCKSNNIKVLIYNNSTPMVSQAFYGWKGLVAVQMDNGDDTYTMTTDSAKGWMQFLECSNLKYFKFPRNYVNNYQNYMFPCYCFQKCYKLETVIFPEVVPEGLYKYYGVCSFDSTAVREFVMPAHNDATVADDRTFTNSQVTTGTVNIHKYTDEMTFVRAAAYAALTIDDISADASKETNIAAVKSAIKGSANAETFRDSLSYSFDFTDTPAFSKKAFEISDGTDTFVVSKAVSKALSDLRVEGYTIAPGFDGGVTEYSVQVPNECTSVSISATPVNGAVLGQISGNTNLSVGNNIATVKVTNIGGTEVTYTINVYRQGVLPAEVADAANRYVNSNKNDVTFEGLSAAVKAVEPSITLNASDFYIKHAVNGVRDNTNDYPLNIEGSDGAVAAVFGLNGERYGYTVTFAHKTEQINITETAVVGTSNGFTYDANGNVTAYSGTADKMVFPDGYNGTMLASCKSNNIKVLIYNNSTPMVSQAFYGWKGLVAVQMDNGDDTYTMTTDSAKGWMQFLECSNLKYFKFPRNYVNNHQNYMFPCYCFQKCYKLETVIFPEVVPEGLYKYYGVCSFDSTAVREFVMPAHNDAAVVDDRTFTNSQVTTGTVNIHKYTDEMTFVRAAAYAALAIDDISADASEETNIAAVKSAIKGSANAETLRDSLFYSFDFNDAPSFDKKSFSISDGTDSFSTSKVTAKALSDLSVAGYSITPAFNSEATEYSVNVPNDCTSVNISATPVSGATLGQISGNTDLVVGDNTATVKVMNTDGAEVTYTVNIRRQSVLSDEVLGAANSYIDANKNNVTFEGLSAAVKAVEPSITLNASDFYIKHAVNGVCDNTNDYPLNIEGSNGAVAAVFELNGERYGYTATFAHETELINITETAVVGTSNGFTYDGDGNVTAYSGTADKIVVPSTFKGRFIPFEDLTTVDGVKVLIYNSSIPFITDEFANWDGLIAVQMDNGTAEFMLAQDAAKTNTRLTGMFKECDNLKYFKFPQKANNGVYYNAMFPNNMFYNCAKLETVIMPVMPGCNYGTYGSTPFYGTSVREFVMPQSTNVNCADNNNAFGGSKITAGTVNIHRYIDDMTEIRAVAYAAAAASEVSIANQNAVISTAKAGIVGAANAAALADSFEFAWNKQVDNNYKVSGKLSITASDRFTTELELSKTVTSIEVKNYAIIETFDPAVTKYSVVIPYGITNVDVDVNLTDGAVLVAKDCDILDNTLTVSVSSTDGNQIDYSIEVVRKLINNAETLVLVKKALLGVENYQEIDVNEDGNFDIRDLVRMKKNIVNPEYPVKNELNCYITNAYSDTAIGKDEFKSSVAYMKDGKAVGTLYDSFIMLPSPNFVYDYSPNGNGGVISTRKALNKEDWLGYANKQFAENVNCNALEEATEEVKNELGYDDYKVNVFLSIFNPSHEVTEFGEVNGKNLDMSNSADRLTAIKFMIDESINLFNSQDYKNINLAGFYWFHESIDMQADGQLIADVVEYIHSLNYKAWWTPYFEAPGYDSFEPCNFDFVTMQINYFPDDPAASNAGGIERIAQAADIIKNRDMGLQLELSSTSENAVRGFKEYLKGGVTYGFSDRITSSYLQYGPKNLKQLCDSGNSYLRSAYEELYKFILGNLSAVDVVI